MANTIVKLRMLQTVNALVGGNTRRLVAGTVYEVPFDDVVNDLCRARYGELVADEPAAEVERAVIEPTETATAPAQKAHKRKG